MGKSNLNVRPKILIVITILIILIVGVLYLAILYFKAVFLISDMDHITLENDSKSILEVEGLEYEYRMDTLLLKDEPILGKLFLKNGNSFDILYIEYIDYYAIIIDEQYGYYIIHGPNLSSERYRTAESAGHRRASVLAIA